MSDENYTENVICRAIWFIECLSTYQFPLQVVLRLKNMFSISSEKNSHTLSEYL
jgi:hypothetical protein